jgi:hypothetical protein
LSADARPSIVPSGGTAETPAIGPPVALVIATHVAAPVIAGPLLPSFWVGTIGA